MTRVASLLVVRLDLIGRTRNGCSGGCFDRGGCCVACAAFAVDRCLLGLIVLLGGYSFGDSVGLAYGLG